MPFPEILLEAAWVFAHRRWARWRMHRKEAKTFRRRRPAAGWDPGEPVVNDAMVALEECHGRLVLELRDAEDMVVADIGRLFVGGPKRRGRTTAALDGLAQCLAALSPEADRSLKEAGFSTSAVTESIANARRAWLEPPARWDALLALIAELDRGMQHVQDRLPRKVVRY